MDHTILNYLTIAKEGGKKKKKKKEKRSSVKDFVKAHESFFFFECTRAHTHTLNQIGPLRMTLLIIIHLISRIIVFWCLLIHCVVLTFFFEMVNLT